MAAAVSALPGRSCLIDGEAIACNDKGLAVFELFRPRVASKPVIRAIGGITVR